MISLDFGREAGPSGLDDPCQETQQIFSSPSASLPIADEEVAEASAQKFAPPPIFFELCRSLIHYPWMPLLTVISVLHAGTD